MSKQLQITTKLEEKMKETQASESDLETLSLELYTDWKVPVGDQKRAQKIRNEKIGFYASAIFELIERSCEEYVPVSPSEISSSYAHHHLMAIREAAELGKHLVNSQI